MTINFDNVYLNNTSVVAGPFLYDGPLKGNFDDEYKDFYDGEKTYEDCEIKELIKSINILIKKEKNKKIDLMISSDLNNQLIVSNFASKNFGIPYLGVYNACASICEELIIAGSLLYNKDIHNIICTTSGHNMTSERTYRNPTEYGASKPEYSTFTVSSGTSCLVSDIKSSIKIESGTIGKVFDLNIKDSNDMGSAMTPSAVLTLFEHLKDLNRKPNYYDLIISGDLGKYGEKMFKELYKEEYGIELNNYIDSAVHIYNNEDKRVLAGGSGPSCLPSYVYSKIIPDMKSKKLKKVLLLATGALLNTTSVNQKKTIPCVCHAVSMEVI